MAYVRDTGKESERGGLRPKDVVKTPQNRRAQLVKYMPGDDKWQANYLDEPRPEWRGVILQPRHIHLVDDEDLEAAA